MSNIGKLTGYDKLDLSDAAGSAVRFMIENYYSILNIASRLNNGDVGAAFRDIMDKGLQELGMICEMDEQICKEEERHAAIE